VWAGEALWLELTDKRGIDFLDVTLDDKFVQLLRVLILINPVGVFVP
jgi:hypothetical protein